MPYYRVYCHSRCVLLCSATLFAFYLFGCCLTARHSRCHLTFGRAFLFGSFAPVRSVLRLVRLFAFAVRLQYWDHYSSFNSGRIYRLDLPTVRWACGRCCAGPDSSYWADKAAAPPAPLRATPIPFQTLVLRVARIYTGYPRGGWFSPVLHLAFQRRTVSHCSAAYCLPLPDGCLAGLWRIARNDKRASLPRSRLFCSRWFTGSLRSAFIYRSALVLLTASRNIRGPCVVALASALNIMVGCGPASGCGTFVSSTARCLPGCILIRFFGFVDGRGYRALSRLVAVCYTPLLGRQHWDVQIAWTRCSGSA